MNNARPPARRGGRPRIPPERQRRSLTVRLRPALLRHLEEAAAKGARSLSQEVEMRCEAYETGSPTERDTEAEEQKPELRALADRLDPFEHRLHRIAPADRVPFYLSCFGDPLARGVQISALPILTEGILHGLARVLGTTKKDAMHWWLGVWTVTMPFLHQPFAAVTVEPAVSPDGAPVS
jgi:hypothetical protein